MTENIEGFATVSMFGKVLYSIMIGSIAAVAAYLNIPAELFGIYFVLLFIDLLTGLSAAFIVEEVITKARFMAGFFSKLLMIIIPITVALIIKMEGTSFIWFLKWTLIVLAVSEGFSIFNNVLKAKNKPPLPEFDAISVISMKLREILEILFKKGG